MLSRDQVDMVLERQRETRQLFGEIATEAGILSPEALDRLLQIQQLRTVFEAAEAIVLAGVCPTAEMMGVLSRFLAETFGPVSPNPPCKTEHAAST